MPRDQVARAYQHCQRTAQTVIANAEISAGWAKGWVKTHAQHIGRGIIYYRLILERLTPAPAVRPCRWSNGGNRAGSC